MRENRTHGSEGGAGKTVPTPINKCSSGNRGMMTQPPWGCFHTPCQPRVAAGSYDPAATEGLCYVAPWGKRTYFAKFVAVLTALTSPKGAESIKPRGIAPGKMRIIINEP